MLDNFCKYVIMCFSRVECKIKMTIYKTQTAGISLIEEDCFFGHHANAGRWFQGNNEKKEDNNDQIVI